jgi:hypothetical protein
LGNRESVPGEVRLELGGIVLSLLPASSDVRFDLGDLYGPFVSHASPEVTLRVHHGPATCSELGHPLFDSRGSWTLHRMQGKLIIRTCSSRFGLYQLVVLEPDLRCGDIYCVGELWTRRNRRLPPLEYPLAEVLFINLLAQGRGVLLHAVAVSDGGRGIIFAGTSGAGKSTLATLWEGREGVTLLSDDRVIVRQREGRFWVYGTPWHGDARAASPEAVPLEQIFVIRHAGENRAVPLEPLDAASRLLVRSFPTFWDAKGMAFTLDFLGQLSQAVPCYELGFVADESIVDFVRCVN